jgi:hypothetical protein
MTINLLDDQSSWIKGNIPPPLDKCKSMKNLAREKISL